MQMTAIVSSNVEEHGTALLAVPVHGEPGHPGKPVLPAGSEERVLQAVAPADIRATPGAWTVVYPGRPGGAERVLLLGAGPREGLTSERVRRFAGHAVRAAEQLGVSDITLYVRPGDGAPPVRVAEAAATARVQAAAW